MYYQSAAYPSNVVDPGTRMSQSQTIGYTSNGQPIQMANVMLGQNGYYFPGNGGAMVMNGPGQPYYGGGNAILIQTPNTAYQSSTTSYPANHKCGSIWNGSIQIAAGVVSFVFAVLANVYQAEYHYTGIGYWAGTMYIITGILAIIASKNSSRCMVISTFVFTIIALCCAVTLFCLGIVGCIYDAHWYCDYWGYPNYGLYCRTSWERAAAVAVATNGVLAGMAGVEIVSCVWLFVICIRAICCSPRCEAVHPQQQSIPPAYEGPQSGSQQTINTQENLPKQF